MIGVCSFRGGLEITTHPVVLTVRLDADLRSAMEEERALLDDETVQETIARRLTEGVGIAEVIGRDDLLWRPVNTRAHGMDVLVSYQTERKLGELAEAFGYELDVIVCTIIYNDACKPWLVRQTERQIPFGPLRSEPGRGKIYSIRFDLAGFEIAFLKLVAGYTTGRDEVIGRALLALARQLLTTPTIGTSIASEEAVQFARKMVRNSDFGHRGLRRSRPS